MSEYKPDGYAIIKLTSHDPKRVEYFVFGSWNGGYLDGDYWRRNSGVVEFNEDNKYYYFHGSSGSVYECDKIRDHISNYNYNVLNQIIENTNEDKRHFAELITVEEFKQEWENNRCQD